MLLMILVLLPLLATVSCSNDDEPKETPENVYSLSKSEMAQKVYGNVWVIDRESVKYYDGDGNEIDGDYIFYSGTGGMEAFKLEDGTLAGYSEYCPRFWDKIEIEAVYREDDGCVYTPESSAIPVMRIESVNTERLMVSRHFGLITEYKPDGSKEINPSAYARYECRIATPDEKAFYEGLLLRNTDEWYEKLTGGDI